MNTLQSMALREVYDIASIKEDLKENQLLFELNDRPKEEYELRKQELQSQLEVAEKVHEQISGRVEVKGK